MKGLVYLFDKKNDTLYSMWQDELQTRNIDDAFLTLQESPKKSPPSPEAKRVPQMKYPFTVTTFDKMLAMQMDLESKVSTKLFQLSIQMCAVMWGPKGIVVLLYCRLAFQDHFDQSTTLKHSKLLPTFCPGGGGGGHHGTRTFCI